MNVFWSEGGHKPYFSHRIKVAECTNEMYVWCKNYEDEGRYFRRFHVEWKSVYGQRDYDIVQFEWEEAAIMFALTFNIRN
jgi:hypothetical protein